MSRRGIRERAIDAICYAILAGVSLFSAGPILWLVVTSFKPDRDFVALRPQLLPSSFTLDNYSFFWTGSDLLHAMGNSLAAVSLTLAICVSSGTLAAYALSRFDFRGRAQLLVLYLLVRMLPPVILATPMYIMLRKVGLVDTQLGLALSYTSFVLPNFIWMACSFFDAVPTDIEDAARVDGASRLGAMVRVAIPLASTGLAVAAAFVAIIAWNEFIFALLLTSGAGSRTWPVALQLMVGEFQLPWGLLAAGGILSILPVLTLFAVFGRPMINAALDGIARNLP